MPNPDDTEVRTFTARWIFPVVGEPLHHGTVSVRGDRIEAVLPGGVRSADLDLGNVAILPGLVNAHTHLDLSGARGLIPPTDPHRFTDWLQAVIAYRRSRTPDETRADIQAGLAECQRFGTTLLGDISSEGASWPILAGAKTRAVVYYELLGLSEQRAEAANMRASDFAKSVTGQQVGSPFVRLGFSPHAPYSARRTLFAHDGPDGVDALFATHLAESPAELELLENGTGPFVDFLTALGVYDPSGVGSLDSLLRRTQAQRHYVFAHGNYLPPKYSQFMRGLHTIAYCPRTHAAFGHSPHPFREFQARGVRVCLGTDSLASNPTLDVLAETRCVRSQYPDFPGDLLLRMATLLGAESLGWAHECGSLEVGKSADFVAVSLDSAEPADPHELLFSYPETAKRRTLWRGEWR
jgi:aminodeoxyfutalosine deaminase